ncbi:MAG: UDP-N-acetylmuramoyl-L-alanine--D-glutamate ligase [Gallionella sp.]|nr:UDP-N-acetylmuramoyl-L-alanine--D-glutamate ligase [Gallionella sp.]
MNRWADKHVLVLGLGETGLSLVRWLSAQGAHVRVADSRSEPPGAAALRGEFPQVEVHCGAFSDSLLQGVTLVAISPGVPLAEPLVQQAIARGIPVEGDIELFAQELNSGTSIPAPRVIAITGANGKTTVASMVEHMCQSAGKDAIAAGNISPAVLDVMMERGVKQPDVWVLELSSFQLETTSSLNADAATVLNISEDHLDRYASMDDYAAAKARIFKNCAVQVLNRDDARSIVMAIPGRHIVTFGIEPGGAGMAATGNEDGRTTGGDWGIINEGADVWLAHGNQRLMKASELQVSGMHNVANSLAALALCRAIGMSLPLLLDALRTFKGLPHRVERVAEIDGVIYYDDSKGTNVGATEAALRGLGCKAVVILGGEGKGQDFAPLNPAVAQHARGVVLIGRDAPLIEAALQGCGVPIVRASDMVDAVNQSVRLARAGDAVLMSPACASFDMFRNYTHRAEAFVAAVRGLTKEVA